MVLLTSIVLFPGVTFAGYTKHVLYMLLLKPLYFSYQLGMPVYCRSSSQNIYFTL